MACSEKNSVVPFIWFYILLSYDKLNVNIAKKKKPVNDGNIYYASRFYCYIITITFQNYRMVLVRINRISIECPWILLRRN